MKNIISLLVLLIILVQHIFGIQDVLSKVFYNDDNDHFHQNTYKVKDKRTEVIRFNKNIFHNFEIKTFKFNRTTPAHNVTIYPKVNLEDKLEGIVQVYKFLSNEFRYFPVRFQVNCKKAFDANVGGLQKLNKCGNMTNFYFHKDVKYYFCNFVFDDNHFPPLIPNGIYKIEILLLLLNQDVGLFNLYGEIHTPMAYPKK